MYQPMQRTSTTPSERTLLSRSPVRRGFLLIPFAIALASLALSPVARAADGGIPPNNTAEGDGALNSPTPGTENTAVGFNALGGNTANFNTATGFKALSQNQTGFGNTATGTKALLSNQTGNNNTANGFGALQQSTGSFNTATGSGALSGGLGNIGNNNTATGASALLINKADNNTANGAHALQNNQTGFNNTANGFRALESNTMGTANTANGAFALFRNTGDSNIGLGFGAGANLTTGNNNITIGNNRGVAGDSRTIRIGTAGTQNATFIAGISGAIVPSGVGVIVGTDGQLGTVTSSERFKEAIKPMGKASEAILALKPVTFRYKRKLDPEGIPQFGLVAEQVEKVNPDLVARDGQGKVNTVRYEAVNAMLLNEFLKEHRKVQELEAAIAQQQKDFQSTAARQQKEIKALAASLKEQALQIQKVSDQRKVSKFAPQTATGG